MTVTVSRTIALCFVAALFEGLDIHSRWVSQPRSSRLLSISGPGQLGIALSASTFGLMLGAAGGGWLSDRFGRKSVLVFSMIALGLFSLATTIAATVQSLLLARVLAGIGLGGASLPTLIALVIGDRFLEIPSDGACVNVLRTTERRRRRGSGGRTRVVGLALHLLHRGPRPTASRARSWLDTSSVALGHIGVMHRTAHSAGYPAYSARAR